MTSKGVLLFSLIFSLAQSLTFAASSEANANWPQWRGPLATGVAPEGNPPLEWSETKNVKWKVKTPGFGTSTPIIWGNRVFILTALPTGKKTEAKPASKTPEKTD